MIFTTPQNVKIKTVNFNLGREISTVALLLICIILSSFPWSLHGLNWSDRTWLFHFGNRLINGDFPYRDYIFLTGFIPIWGDAFFQMIFGQTYISSLVAALSIKILTLLLFYMTFRQFTSRLISATTCIGLALINPTVATWNNEYVNLFISGSSLFIVLGLRETNKETSWLNFLYVTIAGLSLALAVGARQSNGIACIIVTLGVILVYTLRNPRKYLYNLMIPFIIGSLLGLGSLLVILSINHALPQALQQVFLDAAEKKNISTFVSLLDAFSGGITPKSSIIDILKFVVIPLIISGLIFRLTQDKIISNDQKQTNLYKIGILIMPVLLIMGIACGNLFQASPKTLAFLTNLTWYDLPRTFFSLALLASCIFRKNSTTILGVPNPLFSLLTAFTLGTTWAMQISSPGRSYVYPMMLIILVFQVFLMSNKISALWKKRLSLLFLGVTVSIFTVLIVSQSLIVGGTSLRLGAINDGTLRNTQYTLDHPMTKFIRVSREKSVVFAMLREHIKPGDSCFIYSSAPVLYTLLECNNPTLVDSAFVDFYTLNDARKAVSSLKANPPEWLIAQGIFIEKMFDGSPDFYGKFSQLAPRELHSNLQQLMKNYQLVATAKDLFPKGENLMSEDNDRIIQLRLYKRIK